MKIGDYTYKGFEYTVEFNVGKDWKTEEHKFYAAGGIFSSGYSSTFDGAVSDIKNKIDFFLVSVPKDVDELVEELSKLLVWHGYEECELDAVATKTLITSFIESEKAKGK